MLLLNHRILDHFFHPLFGKGAIEIYCGTVLTVDKYWPMLALVALVLLIVGVSQYSDIARQPRAHSDKQADASPTASGNADQASGNPSDASKPPPRAKLFAWPEGVTAWAVLLTLFVIAWQSVETRAAALATEESVVAGRDSAKRQMRAYIGVTIGDGMYQEREKGFRFGALPILTNSGQTPAHKVRLLVKAAILPLPLPRDYVLSEIGDNLGETTIGIAQPMILHGRVEDFCHDDDVETVKAGDRDKALYVWGIVHYEDVFGEKHYTRFCHRMKWLAEGKVYGYYEPNRNDAS